MFEPIRPSPTIPNFMFDPSGRRISWPVHVGVAIVGRRNQSLLDRAGADPANEVPHRAGLVVGTRAAGAAERLLAHDRTGRLVVDVKVSRRVAKSRSSGRDGLLL